MTFTKWKGTKGEYEIGSPMDGGAPGGWFTGFIVDSSTIAPMWARRAVHGRMEEKLMPDFDFDTRTPQEASEPNRPRMRLIANRLNRLLSAAKLRVWSMASTLRRSLMTNKLRNLLIGGVLIFVVAPASVGLLLYSLGRTNYPQQAEYLNGKIVFEYTSESGTRIWTMNADGSNMTPVKESVDGENVALSPDGEKIAFTEINEKVDTSASASASASASGPPTISVPHVFVKNAGGSDKNRLLNSPAAEPAWSPAGQQIAVSSDEKWSTEGLESGKCDIYVVDLDGSDPPKRLTGESGCETDPAWSPDGAEIAFSCPRQRTYDICVVNADGSGTRRRLTDDPGADAEPSWSPSGSEIAFTHYSHDGDTDIRKTNVDGSGNALLTFSPLSEAEPTWSPDGEQISFVRYSLAVEGYAESPMAIYKMDSDGTDPVLIKNFEKPVAHNPAWWGTPQQDVGVEQATEEVHTEQAMKDWQALPEAELQTYMDQINRLVQEENLRESEEDSSVRRLAKKETLDLLRRLDKSRKEELVRFLAEADVVQILDLSEVDLNDTNLSGVDLSGAHMHFTALHGANLNGANLSDADLSEANLTNTDLSNANLSGANLYGAGLDDAVLSSANLSHANLKYSEVNDATLTNADLRGTDLSDVYLYSSDLSGANLSGANLSGALLPHANLSGATGVTEQSLERQILPEASYGLDGTTMPDGSIHPCVRPCT